MWRQIVHICPKSCLYIFHLGCIWKMLHQKYMFKNVSQSKHTCMRWLFFLQIWAFIGYLFPTAWINSLIAFCPVGLLEMYYLHFYLSEKIFFIFCLHFERYFCQKTFGQFFSFCAISLFFHCLLASIVVMRSQPTVILIVAILHSMSYFHFSFKFFSLFWF